MQQVQRVPEGNEYQLNDLGIAKTSARDTLISNDLYRVYGKTLQRYCGNNIDETVWRIPLSDGIRHANISFEKLFVPEDELRLIKAYIVSILSIHSSPSTCAAKARNIAFFFQFLHEKGFQVTMISTPVINIFRLWLDEIESLSTARKNAIEADLYGLIAFLREHGLARPGTITIPRPRATPPSQLVRAPDRSILSQLDDYFFDYANLIPSVYRCLYILLRMIPARNQEVLSMMVDDFWVDEDLLGIRISTYKETANHKPVHQIHYRFAETYPERLLLRGLREQKDYALECQQTIIQPSLKNRLMVSNNNPSKLVDSEEFNSYLKAVCAELGIVDDHGTPVHITMYSLRHANGAELAFCPEISGEEFSRVFAHNSRFSDDGYGYGSKHDELCRTAPFTKQVRDILSPGEDSESARPVTPMRLAKIQKDLHSHLIGIKSVCQENGCSPSFENCVFCDAYLPDPQYISEAELCCEILRKRIELCKDKNDDEALQFNERQLSVYVTFIQRAEEYKEGDTNGGETNKH